MADYDIGAAFEAIENELIASMTRNFRRHRAEETEKGYMWSMWQVEQLKALDQYKRRNTKKYKAQFANINQKIANLIRDARKQGNMDQEIEILEAVKNGWNSPTGHTGNIQTTAKFFQMNDRKMNALVKATTDDMEKAETAILRRANDQYRKVIYNAQVYANSGAGTYEKAIDMATHDFLLAGINCVMYKDGSQHTVSEYASMALRTGVKRAYLTGEGEKRQEWGIVTVIVNKRGNPCEKCLPFCGKILIDDVWSGGSTEDGDYPLVSTAIEAGLYHPNCKDSHTTYFPEITTSDGGWTKEELAEVQRRSKQEAKRRNAERYAKKYERVAKNALDPETKAQYEEKAAEWRRKSDLPLAKTPKADIIDLSVDTGDIGNAKSGDDALRNVAEQVLREARTKYSYLQGYGKNIISDDSISGLYVSRMEVIGDRIEISLRASRDWQDAEELIDSVKNAVEYGFFPPNYTPKSLVYHEYGHMTEIAMALHDAGAHLGSGNSLSSVEKARKLVRDGTISKAIRDEALASLHIEESKVAEQLSERAKMDSREFLAEAFGEYESQNPRPLAAKTIEILLRELRKRGMIQ